MLLSTLYQLKVKYCSVANLRDINTEIKAFQKSRDLNNLNNKTSRM